MLKGAGMSRDGSKPRSHEHEITIDAPIEAVWKALTDAEELTRWLCDKARVIPGQGGRMWSAWGEDDLQPDGKTIDVWEPGKRLRLLLDPASHNTGPAATAANLITVPIVLEYTLETRDGKTVLRLVHSGIPDAQEWDGFFEGTKAGWPMFFIGLRHYLEKNAGKHRDSIVLMQAIDDSPEAAWNKLGRACELAPSGSGQLQAGERYTSKAGRGLGLEGRIEIYNPPKVLLVTADNLDNSLLAVSFEEAQGMNFTYIALSTYGLDHAQLQALREEWLNWLKGLFPAPRGEPKSKGE
jgi:uncharacterized protein YndB with AHSA1/START domain